MSPPIETARLRSLIAQADAAWAAMQRVNARVDQAREAVSDCHRNADAANRDANNGFYVEPGPGLKQAVEETRQRRARDAEAGGVALQNAKEALAVAQAEHERLQSEWHIAKRLADAAKIYAEKTASLPAGIDLPFHDRNKPFHQPTIVVS